MRRAFSAAIDRRSLIEDVTKTGQVPANTFAPEGVFGSAAQNPKIAPWALDPELGEQKAQEWLAEAGYPDGEGFPTVTLMHNTNEAHRAIAESVASMWESTLGVQIDIQDGEWHAYLDLIEKTTPLAEVPHVWRLGWCADYFDQNNWVHEVFNCEEGANRLRRNCVDPTCSEAQPSELDDLTQQAGSITDPEQRKALYRQAEEILSEEEAAYAPLYYYTHPGITKPYLERGYPVGGGLGHIATWRLTHVGDVIGTDGGILTTYDSSTSIELPSGAVSEPTVLLHRPATGMPRRGKLNSFGRVFNLTALYSDTGMAAQIVPGYVYSVTVHYTEAKLGPTAEDTLALYGWDQDAGAWTQEGISNTLDTVADTLTAQVDHFSQFAVIGKTNRVYLPLVLRSR